MVSTVLFEKTPVISLCGLYFAQVSCMLLPWLLTFPLVMPGSYQGTELIGRDPPRGDIP